MQTVITEDPDNGWTLHGNMTAVTACGGGVTRPSAVTFVAAAGAGAGINIKTQPLLAITSAPHCKVTVARDSVLQKTGKL